MTKNRRHDIVKPSKYKTSMCTFFRSEEGCPFGDKCAFAHGEDELRAEPRDTATESDVVTADAVAPAGAAFLTSESPFSERVDVKPAVGNGQPNDAPARKLQQDPSAITSTAAGAKRKAKKGGLDSSSLLPGNARGGPSGSGGCAAAARGDALATRGRTLPNRRQQLPPPSSLPGHGAMPPAAFRLAVPPPLLAPTTPSFGLSNDFGSLAYSGMPAMMPGMPYYIPAMGHHPFSIINNNQHTINVAPVMQSATSYTTLQHGMQLPPPPPPTASCSSALPRVTGPANDVAVADALPSEDTEHHQCQSLRHVVSSNTIGHGTGPHPTNASAAALDEMATPQYVYGLMSKAGALPNSSQAAGSNSQPSSGVEPPTQPPLLLIPHSPDSGSYVIPNTVMNYPHTEPQSVAAVRGLAAVSSPRHSTGSAPGSSDSGARSHQPTPTTLNSNSGAALQFPSPDLLASAPAPATVPHLPLNSASNGQSGGGSSTVVGDPLWGPTEGTMHPLTSSLVSHNSADTSTGGHITSAGDYNAILSDLGIGGSSYTTIPLDWLMRQRDASSSEDDASLGGDLDWSAAVGRWLQSAREDGTMTGTAAAETGDFSTVANTTVPKAEVPITSPPESDPAAAKNSATPIITFHPEGGRSLTATLNSHPVLMNTEVKSKAASASSSTPVPPETEAKRRPAAVVCQMPREADGKPFESQRRAPIMKNQFKSSCAAEADSGAVLLYCAEKNTLVYISSDGSGAAVGVSPARRRDQATVATTSSAAERSPSEVELSVATVAALPAVASSQDTPKTAGTRDSLGIHVRFVPGRKKRSVLEEVPDEDAEYCI
ncbi:hypothetical protein LSCM4_07183 [Leishmania orientalis]|uniref:C3H1-type domain-containing protein n=1 Tax=Leishmania orientalis TaxID=2249476 RepID=A0A836KPL4_9TRYP|nr:hypothetical protein LSCM4_07183 [Leishmania orientalis]